MLFTVKQKLKSNFVYFIAGLISLLLFVNILLIRSNNEKVEYNKKMGENAEKIKVNTLDIIRSIHQFDMGLRGYALIGSAKQHQAFTEGLIQKDEIFESLSASLQEQQFDMSAFQQMVDSINIYAAITIQMEQLLKEKKLKEFNVILLSDPGYEAWKTYFNFSKKINAFENQIAAEVEIKYHQALSNSFILQIILFFIALPTLGYTAYYSSRSLSLSEKLRTSEFEKNEILTKQKSDLERMVQERTNEILLQNEEITAQNEEIISHNEQLVFQQNKIEKQHESLLDHNNKIHGAYHTIELQNEIIQKRNNELSIEVANQTQDLRKTNSELIEQNSRLEQFTFIISHNLRAPMTRLIGLSTLLDIVKTEHEKEDIVKLMVRSTTELDQVIKDLSKIIGIQKLNTSVYSEIKLEELVQKLGNMLDQDISDTKAEISTHFDVPSIYSLPQYIESIFYNLVSNAIKYRHPEKRPIIKIRNYIKDNFIIIEFSDQGLGIDIEKHKSNLFNLYKRFHFHVEGKGLGLYLVKTQVESLGGTIAVESKVGQGTTFIVSVPLT